MPKIAEMVYNYSATCCVSAGVVRKCTSTQIACVIMFPDTIEQVL